MPSDAKSIYQKWLDDTGPATLINDLEVIDAHFALPYRHNSSACSVLIETKRDMHRRQTAFADQLRSLGINHFIRLVTDAEFLSEDYIEGYHTTHILRNATPVVPSFTDRIVLRRFESGWKVIEVVASLGHGPWPLKALRAQVPDRAPVKTCANDARRELQSPMIIYQDFLNALSQANMSGDFETYVKLVSYPYTVHTASEDTVFAGPEDTRGFFDTLQTMINEHEVTLFERRAERAEFVSGNLICGYHTSVFQKDGVHMICPVQSRMILCREGTSWFLKSVTNALDTNEFNYSDAAPTDGLVTHVEIQERFKQ